MCWLPYRSDIKSFITFIIKLFPIHHVSVFFFKTIILIHISFDCFFRQQEQKVLSLETEIEGYKKSIFKEQEQNEKLTLILNKTERDIETVKKQLNQCQAKHDALKASYATYTRMLHETEQALNRAVTVSFPSRYNGLNSYGIL